MKSRSDKISFLKGVQIGNRSIKELASKTFEVFVQDQLNKAAFNRQADNIRYTKDEIEKFKKSNPNSNIVVMLDKDTIAPVLSSTDIIWREQKIIRNENSTE